MLEGEEAEQLIDALCYGELQLPGMDESFMQLLARINLVCVASPELGYPAFDEAGLRAFFRSVVEGSEEPEKVDARGALAEFVGEVRLGWLDEIVPVRWRLGKDGGFDLRYAAETNPGEGAAFSPVAEVKAEDLTEMRDHPFVCEGRVAVRLRLLDAKGKFLEETLDWPGYSASMISRSSR